MHTNSGKLYLCIVRMSKNISLSDWIMFLSPERTHLVWRGKKICFWSSNGFSKKFSLLFYVFVYIKSSHIYLYSAFHNTDCIKAASH